MHWPELSRAIFSRVKTGAPPQARCVFENSAPHRREQNVRRLAVESRVLQGVVCAGDGFCARAPFGDTRARMCRVVSGRRDRSLNGRLSAVR
eukprot:5550416-Pleurochrysis_carterae.AAC.1